MKKINFKRFLILASCILIFSIVLAACNADSSSTTTTNSNETTSDTAGTDNAPATGSLTVMCQVISPDENGQQLKDYIKEQLGIDVEFEPAPISYADNVNKTTTNLASGDSSIDVYHIDEIMQLAFLSADFLAPVQDVITDDVLADFLPGYADTFLKKDGNTYGVPADIGGIMFYVNQKMFDDNNIEIPTNQTEFIEAAQALTKDGKQGLIEAWDKASHLQDNLNRWSLMFGGDYLDWTLPETQEAIKFMYDLANTYNVVSIDNLSDNYETGNQKMTDGLGAMYFQWAGAIATFDSAGKYGSEIKVAPMPTFKTNKTPMSSWMWVVNKNSENQDNAKEFLKIMASEKAQSLYMKSTWNSPTANLKVWEDNELTAGLNAINEHKEYLEVNSLTPRNLLVKQSEFMDTATGTLQRYLLGEITFDECIELGQEQIDKLKN